MKGSLVQRELPTKSGEGLFYNPSVSPREPPPLTQGRLYCVTKIKTGKPQTSLPILSRIEKLLLESSNSLLELINASAGVNKLLLTGEEGVALGANVNSLLAALGGSGLYNLTARATNGANLVIRMDSVFHVHVPLF